MLFTCLMLLHVNRTIFFYACINRQYQEATLHITVDLTCCAKAKIVNDVLIPGPLVISSGLLSNSEVDAII